MAVRPWFLSTESAGHGPAPPSKGLGAQVPSTARSPASLRSWDTGSRVVVAPPPPTLAARPIPTALDTALPGQPRRRLSAEDLKMQE